MIDMTGASGKRAKNREHVDLERSVKVEVNSVGTRVALGTTLFDCAQEVAVRVPTSCVKQGKCKECLVEVESGIEHLSAPSPEEQHLTGNFRLACQARVEDGEGLIKCHTLRRASMRIEEHSVLLQNTLALEIDPSVTRDGDRILLDGEEITRSGEGVYGLAVDLGTTTVVMRLHNLETGFTEATQSFENPQRFGGSDVMARIRYDSDHRGRHLRRTLVGYMGHAIEDFPCRPDSIYEVAIVGNPTMRDLFFGLDVYSIGQKPYRSISEYELRAGKRKDTALTSTARRLKLPIHPKARIYGLPLIGSHVGADAAACLLAIGLESEERTVALMDIGTNTELIVGNRSHVLAASCPAGPAFEGMGLSCGMPGLDGAVERIRIKSDGSAEAEVIGGGSADGICGSGLVDLLSELMRTARLNSLGRFTDFSHRFVVDAEREIFLQENDISLLAQAKGANVAGLQIVLSRYGIAFDDLDRFYLAGGFARHLSVSAARRIGLIPDLPDDRIVQLGNAAIEGASIALLSRKRRRELESFVKRIEHVELETDPSFFDYFVRGCQFVPVESPVPLI